MELFTGENPVFAGYAFYSGILALKMILMAFLTGYTRFKKQAFVNPEDARMAGVETKLAPDDDVERIRRAHLNDVENILIFMATGLIFVAADPNAIFALMLFRIYALARILHTVFYVVYIVKMPTRSIFFQIGALTNIIIILIIKSLVKVSPQLMKTVARNSRARLPAVLFGRALFHVFCFCGENQWSDRVHRVLIPKVRFLCKEFQNPPMV